VDNFGTPEPTVVTEGIQEGPGILITGHDLMDLKDLLEQANNAGVNVYTHGEMLPGHSYPGLKKYPHLKGHFGSAWQKQRVEFERFGGPILGTTNYGGTAEELTFQILTSGTMGMIFVGLGILAGIAAPVTLLLLAPVGKPPQGTLMISALLILLGSAALRYAILMAPQQLQTLF
jgi:hypothetical protein